MRNIAVVRAKVICTVTVISRTFVITEGVRDLGIERRPASALVSANLRKKWRDKMRADKSEC